MDLSLFERIIMLLKMPFSSFLMIEIFLVFVILYIFLIYNLKRNNKKVKFTLAALVIFFFFLLVFYYFDDMVVVFIETVKPILRCFYFPNIIFYNLFAIINVSILIYTMFRTKGTKLHKIITYTFTMIHLFLYTLFISLALTNNIGLVNQASIYKIDEMFVVVLASQSVFLLLIIYELIYHFCYIRKGKLKNK